MNIDTARWESFTQITNPSTGPQQELGYSNQENALAFLEEEYRNSHPQEKFGEVSIALADVKNFIGPFEQALENGYVQNIPDYADGFLASNVQKKGLENIYVVRSPENSSLAQAQPKSWKNHQPSNLKQFIINLEDFRNKIDKKYAHIEEFYRNVYKEITYKQIRFCKNAINFGTPEYTVGQKTLQRWRQLIDIKATKEVGEVSLVHEELAIAILEKGMSIDPEKTQLFENVQQALAFWKLTEKEMAAITGDEELNTNEITPTQGQRLFEVLKNRLGIDWVIEINAESKAIDIDPAARKIYYPATRSLNPDEIVLLPAHELGVHVISGENGAKQLFSLLRTGTLDYLATQEGLAIIAEMIAGEPFGHPRQRLFAARYLAIAMSLKTIKTETGEFKPKHTLQEIYNTLRKYGIPLEDAAKTVWRIVRGTSLTRQVVELDIGDGQSIKVAETFVKDAIYFEGFIKLRNFFMETVPLLEKEVDEQGNISIHGKKPEDFSTRLLARVGRAIAMQKQAKYVGAKDLHSFKTMKTIYNAYVSLGRSALMDIMQNFLVGKLRFEEMTADSPWNEKLIRDGLIEFKNIFEPTTS